MISGADQAGPDAVVIGVPAAVNAVDTTPAASVGSGLIGRRVGRLMIGRAVTSVLVMGNGLGGIARSVLRGSAANGPTVRRVGHVNLRVIGRLTVIVLRVSAVNGRIGLRVGRLMTVRAGTSALVTGNGPGAIALIVPRVSVVNGRIAPRVRIASGMSVPLTNRSSMITTSASCLWVCEPS